MTDWPAPKPEDRFYLAEHSRDLGQPTLMRRNDGSLVVMARVGPDSDDVRPVVLVERVHRVKRAEAWSAEDDDQLAFAVRLVDLLNAHPDVPLVEASR